MVASPKQEDKFFWRYSLIGDLKNQPIGSGLYYYYKQDCIRQKILACLEKLQAYIIQISKVNKKSHLEAAIKKETDWKTAEQKLEKEIASKRIFG